MLNIDNIIMLFSANIQSALTILAHVISLLCQCGPKSCHNTGPQGTFLHHLVDHRTLSKILHEALLCLGKDVFITLSMGYE